MIRSTDGGNSWSQILNGTINATPQIAAGETIPGARLFGSDDPMSGNGAIFRTSDDANYQKVFDTGKDSYGFWFRTNPLNGRIYASFVSGEHSPSTAWIFTSDDNGLSWEIYKTFNVSTPYYGAICASNFIQGIMYYGVKLDSMQYGVKIHPSFTETSYHSYSEDESKLSLPTQTFYNDSCAPLESNISDDASPSADLPILSSDEASWVPLSLGTVAVSTVLPANSNKSQSKRTFRRWKKVRNQGYRIQCSDHNSKIILKGGEKN